MKTLARSVIAGVLATTTLVPAAAVSAQELRPVAVDVTSSAVASDAATPSATVAVTHTEPDFPGASHLAGSTIFKIRTDVETQLTRSGAIRPWPKLTSNFARTVLYDNGCHRPPSATTLTRPADCLYGDPDGTLKVGIVGDSHVLQYYPAINRIAKREGWKLYPMTKSGCTFASAGVYENCRIYNGRLINALTTTRKMDIIFTGSAASNASISATAPKYIQRLSDAGSQIVLIGDSPRPGYDSRTCLLRAGDYRRDCGYTLNWGTGHASQKAIRAAVPEVIYLPAHTWLCPTRATKCPTVIGRYIVFRDKDHLAVPFVYTLGPAFSQFLKSRGITKKPLYYPLHP